MERERPNFSNDPPASNVQFFHAHEFALDDAEEALQTLGRERNPTAQPICVSLHPGA